MSCTLPSPVLHLIESIQYSVCVFGLTRFIFGRKLRQTSNGSDTQPLQYQKCFEERE